MLLFGSIKVIIKSKYIILLTPHTDKEHETLHVTVACLYFLVSNIYKILNIDSLDILEEVSSKSSIKSDDNRLSLFANFFNVPFRYDIWMSHCFGIISMLRSYIIMINQSIDPN